MATSTNTYASVAQVQRRIGDIVINRTFSITTVPSLTDVEAILDETAARINSALLGAGYSAPLSTGNNPIEHKWLESLNAAGASAVILQTFPIESIAYDQQDAGNNRAQNLQREFDQGIKFIMEGSLAAGRTRSKLGNVFAGSQENSDGERKLPIFQRGADKTPGTRGLTE